MKNNKLLLLITLYFFTSLKSITVNIENGLDFPLRVPGYEYTASPGKIISFYINKDIEKFCSDFIYKNDNCVVCDGIIIFDKKLIENFIFNAGILDLRLVLRNGCLDLLVLSPMISIKNNTKYTVFFNGKHFLPGKKINIILPKDVVLLSEKFVFVENRDFSFSEEFCIWDKLFNEKHFLEFIQKRDAIILAPRKK